MFHIDTKWNIAYKSQTTGRERMKRIILTALGLATIASVATAQTNVVLSRNAVGYVRITAYRSNYVHIANNFLNLNAAPITVTNLIGNQVPVGSLVILWDPAAQAYRSENRLITGWTPGTNRLTPGRGFWLTIPGSAPSNEYQVYLMGEVPDRFTQPTATLAVVQGMNMFGHPYPVETFFTNTALAKAGVAGDIAIFWNPIAQAYASENRVIIGWLPGTNVLRPGQAFWYRRSGVQTNWVEPKPYTWP
jgi:hypothetical protein